MGKILYFTGITYAAMGSYEDALSAYTRANEINPRHEKTIFNIGNLVC